MKKIFFGLLLLSAVGSLSGCKESSKIPAPEVTSVPLIFPKFTSDPSKSYFDTPRAAASIDGLATLANPTRPVLEFILNVPDQRDVKIKAVEVYKSFQKPNQQIGPRALAGSYSSFPATVSLSSQQALSGLQRILPVVAPSTLPTLSPLLLSTPASPGARNPIVNGDTIIFTFEYVLEDGSRIILTPLTDVRLDGGGIAKVISGNQVNPPYSLVARFTFL